MLIEKTKPLILREAGKEAGGAHRVLSLLREWDSAQKGVD